MCFGHPPVHGTRAGPLISQQAVADYREGLDRIRSEGGELLSGGKVLDDRPGYFVEPAIVRSRPEMPVVQEEIFAPILHLLTARSLEEAIDLNNGVPQGLSSSLFTTDLRSAEAWLSAAGSDCGIANVNVGTSGAESGGAFGGEKATGAGRRAGSARRHAYIRRLATPATSRRALPAAHGLAFATALPPT